MASITIFAISGMRRKSGPLQAVSRTRSMARNARPETIAEGKLLAERFSQTSAGRLPIGRRLPTCPTSYATGSENVETPGTGQEACASSSSQVCLLAVLNVQPNAVGTQLVLEPLDLQRAGQNSLLRAECGGQARGVAGRHAVAHALAGRGAHMGSRNASPGGQQAVELLGKQRPVGNVVDLHTDQLGIGLAAEIDVAGPPSDGVRELASGHGVFLGDDVAALDAAGLPDADLGTRGAPFHLAKVGILGIANRLDHLQRLAAAPAFGLAALARVGGVNP